MPQGINVNYDPQYDAWVKAGRPGESFEAWKATQPVAAPSTSSSLYNPDGTAKNGSAQPTRNPDGTMRPQTFEERSAAGEFAGDKGVARDLEVRRRRRLDANAPAGVLSLPPDLADIALRDVATGRQRRARGGSSVSALGYFNPTAPLMGVG